MRRLKHWRRGLLSLLLLGLSPLVCAQQHVLYHLNDGNPMQQFRMLRNIVNHFKATPDGNLDVKVLVHGPGLGMLLLPEAQPRVRALLANATANNRKEIDALRARGVQFVVSATALAEYGVDPVHDLYHVTADDIVNNAIAYLADMQARGYAYIKP